MLVRLDNLLRVPVRDLPGNSLEQIKDALTIPNQEKINAKKQDLWGWQKMPDTIQLWRMDRHFKDEDDKIGEPWLYMPAGFLHDFAAGVNEGYGGIVEFVDERFFMELYPEGDTIEPRAWQVPQIKAIKEKGLGIIKSPAGSGKTVAVLAAIQELGCNSLIIVNTKDILWQWQDRALKFLGPDYPVGQIGDGVMDISKYMTVATAQTLHSRFDELKEDGFFDSFSFVCLDECHHATADTYNKLMNEFSSTYRIGVSATPDKTGDFRLAQLVLGDIIHETKPDEVDTLTKPQVFKALTSFKFGFRGQRNRWDRSNYGELISALVADNQRNTQIVDNIRHNLGHHQLVVTKRIEHVDILFNMLSDLDLPDAVMTLTGQDSNLHRESVVKWINNEPGIVISTVADEALDIPRLDRLHLVFPQKNTGLITQQVGRVERIHDDKTDALIYDYVDDLVGPLSKQWSGRRFEVYEPRGYKITTLPRP